MRLVSSSATGEPCSRKVWRAWAAFTLVEMLLAISIAVGMLIVALLFYRQAADLRSQILAESERLATVRLLLDRIAVDLRSVGMSSGSGPEFRGETGSMSFLRASSVTGTEGDRVRITFTSVFSNEGTHQTVRGVDRLEESVGAADPAGNGALASRDLLTLTTVDSSNSVTNTVADPLTELVRFLHFRYWSGAQWLEEWTNGVAPAGVEVVLGFDPLPEGASPAEYPFEQFRRVVFLPTASPLRTSLEAPVELPFIR